MELVRIDVDGDGSFDRTNSLPLRINPRKLTDSRASGPIESGGVVIETDDKKEAQVLPDRLREAGPEVEIEREW